ncbi:helix-turn-helix domain-containing protein [Streptomyces cellulosae]|uniref:helix-turn-helix domain-containing protein n=1 Tax=Streptomyces cellulosae TaxID=1968 RepID=UPI0004CB81C3|nr:XRE family transcriptional regulator [Streptomyces cellulosae]
MTRTTKSPEGARLAAALRDLRTRTGLSMMGLAHRTAFSKSSWERYLNGKTLPPREAVRELCRLAREPEGRCLALWEIAESEWSGRAAQVPQPAPPPQPQHTPPKPEPGPGPESVPVPAEPPAPPARGVGHAGHRGATVAVLATVCAVVVGGVTVALLLLPGMGTARPSPATSLSAVVARCRGTACEGRSPMDMNCGAGPQTLASYRTTSGAMLELRHSEACGSSWARMWDTHIGDRLQMTVAGGHPRSAEVANAVDAAAYVYTPMSATRSGTLVRACFQPAKGDTPECFEGRVREGRAGAVVSATP